MSLTRMALALGLVGSLIVTACSQSAPPPREADAAALAVPDGAAATGAAPLAARAREVQVVVGLAASPVAVAAAEAARLGTPMSGAAQRAHKESLRAAQDVVAQRVGALGGREVARLSMALNAVVVAVDATRLGAIAAMPGVVSVRPVRDYEADLSETVPYVGAAAAQQAGIDGTGVRVAVLDSGIDYTHFNLGGSGVVADFTANDETVVEPGTFPTAKVVRGTDFVGSHWPSAPPPPACPQGQTCAPLPVRLEPDLDPLDKCPAPTPGPDPMHPEVPYPCNSGHGTHVSDIIGGRSADGSHVGVAPGASLYAVKVCSSTSSSCSGVALLQGMDFAIDPNGDGDVSDAVDVVNMSLGSSYGQREDDLSAASANAVRLGVVVVASAGNSADKPFIVGSPSSTPEVISVAQTQVPSARLYRIVAGAVTAGGSWQPWSAAPTFVSGPLRYDTTSASTRIGCTNAAGASPWSGTPLAGAVVLVDRGTCAISMKVSNIAAAGGIAAVIANNAAQAPGDLPPDFSFGGGNPTVAGYSITRSDGTALKGVVGQTATIDPASAASLVGNMVSSSSRGPSFSFGAAKPDIGAPGASVSAQFGTGTGQTAFGGTSGAAPMVTGAVALLLDAHPSRTPAEIKSILMNTAETTIGINPVGLPGVLAPITRIGGGELRVDRALAATTAAWDAEAGTASLSFGYQSAIGTVALKRVVAVRNYSGAARTYAIQPSFRYADDAASGAVQIAAPASLRVPAGATATFTVRLQIDPSKLPVWTLNGGSRGGDGFRLQSVEFDGYIGIRDAGDEVHVAWHVLPHRSAAVDATDAVVLAADGTGSVQLANPKATLDGRVEVFALTGRSGRVPPPALPGDGDNFAVVDLKSVGVRPATLGPTPAVQFAVDTFGSRAHPAYPAEFDVSIDANRDGNPEFVVFNIENGGFAATGQVVIRVFDVAKGTLSPPLVFLDADLESGMAILTVPLAAVGLAPGAQFDFWIEAFDNYFTGARTDATAPMTFTLGTPRFAASLPSVTVPAGGSASLDITSPAGGDAASPSQQGLLLLYRDQREQAESEAVLVTRAAP